MASNLETNQNEVVIYLSDVSFPERNSVVTTSAKKSMVELKTDGKVKKTLEFQRSWRRGWKIQEPSALHTT